MFTIVQVKKINILQWYSQYLAVFATIFIVLIGVFQENTSSVTSKFHV